MAHSNEFQAEFRHTMRRLASTVTVISTQCDGQRYGMTATAVSSVSDEPPSLLVCVNQAASLHDPAAASGRFCINILQSGQAEIAAAFSAKLSAQERFAVGAWMTGPYGLPYLADAQANVFCDVGASMSYATHSIFIGRVREIRARTEVAPLLYQDGAYAAAYPVVGRPPRSCDTTGIDCRATSTLL